jgi:hypothetical protein
MKNATCMHRTFYWVNRTNLNWRCTDECGFQFFDETVTEARKAARMAARLEMVEEPSDPYATFDTPTPRFNPYSRG